MITVTATDALGNRVEASCDVTVTEQPYNVEVYVPKGILAANGLKFAPSAGLDKAGHDIFDTEQVIADVSADTELYNAYDVYTMTLYPGTYSYRAVSAEAEAWAAEHSPFRTVRQALWMDAPFVYFCVRPKYP